MRRTAGLMLAALSLCTAVPAQAQADHAVVAVPFYRPADAMRGLLRHQQVPRAQAFAGAADTLQAALRSHCETSGTDARARLEAARAAWRGALASWERLATVPLGAVIERRAVRELDFNPTRPELIARAIARQPSGPEGMERIGTPAKGLPALEWLLWTRPVAARTPACDYAVQVAAELARSAGDLRSDVEARDAEPWDEPRGDAAFGELINQWVGGVERLRWAQIERPRREAATRKARPIFPRQPSGETAASWSRQWAVLRELAAFDGAAAPPPGDGVVPLETYLRGRGQNALADRWRGQVDRVSAAMRTLQPGDARRLDAATRELASLKTLAESELAPALDVSIGFSDADGD